jgi:hypothetical protein
MYDRPTVTVAVPDPAEFVAVMVYVEVERSTCEPYIRLDPLIETPVVAGLKDHVTSPAAAEFVTVAVPTVVFPDVDTPVKVGEGDVAVIVGAT